MSLLAQKYLPYAAAAAVVLAVVLILGLNMGVSAQTLAFVVLGGACGGLACSTVVFARHLAKRDGEAIKMQQLAERFQSIVRSAPDSYCLFTTQGILREAPRAAAMLGVEKVSHFEDLVSALKDPEEFVSAFRKMQMMGEGFSMAVVGAKSDAPFQVVGARLRIGKDLPELFDILWFSNGASAPAVMPVVQSALLTKPDAVVERVQIIYDGLPFQMWVRDADLNIIRCNQAYAKSLDLTVDDVLKTQHELASATAMGGSGRALASQAMETGVAQTERRHVVVSGKRQLLEITETPFEANGIKGIYGYAVNVTAEEEKDAEVERHAASQREVLERLGSAIAIYGPDTRLEFYNSAYVKLWQSDEAFLDNKPTFSEIIEDQRARRVAPEQADFQRYKRERCALFTSLLEAHEDLMCLPDGTTLRVLVSPHPMGGLIFVHEDVTDKLALESSYNTLIAVQRETLDNLAEGIVVFGPDGKASLYNPALSKMWGLPDDYLSSHPHVTDILDHTQDLHSFDGDWEEYKKKATSYTLDRNPRKGRQNLTNGTVLDYVAVPLPDGAVLNSYLDVTDSIKAERALRASNMALAAADRLKSEFVANVSYQLRTPINTIMGFSEILTNQYFGSLNDRQMEYARTIMEASKKLLLLINDVLDLATIEAGRMAIERSLVSVADLLNVSKQMTAEWARQQSLEILIDCPTSIGKFEVDQHRMKQVLFNLISNAIKYTPAGGRITLEARNTGDWVVLTVADTGIGIPESDMDRVVGKFERTNAHLKQSGVGLGLSLVKSFIELHGGRIEIASVPHQGTRVTCYIPVRAPEQEANAA
ncbi:MAG: PAS-domain containing protein [Alphaproteobacteria bacterium]|nr:PAS-domain containing protein [Alphaproteobacteria bacterium]